ncbi:hypothetical protein [Kitasatospora sp. NPDC048407]|uniref:hypothetical protein n=1 Tax=Kitasatospora sp. NPDC048407 TaxID=3364051 RepID=UPI003719541F
MNVFGRAAMLPTKKCVARSGVTVLVHQRSQDVGEPVGGVGAAELAPRLAGFPVVQTHVVAPAGVVVAAEAVAELVGDPFEGPVVGVQHVGLVDDAVLLRGPGAGVGEAEGVDARRAEQPERGSVGGLEAFDRA